MVQPSHLDPQAQLPETPTPWGQYWRRQHSLHTHSSSWRSSGWQQAQEGTGRCEEKMLWKMGAGRGQGGDMGELGSTGPGQRSEVEYKNARVHTLTSL